MKMISIKFYLESELSKKYPSEYEELTFTYDEFILDSMRGLYKVIREIETKNQLEIKMFLRLLRKFLTEQGISKDLEELEEFYSKNAWKLNFKHNRSRDPDKICNSVQSYREKTNIQLYKLGVGGFDGL